jgi:hypothetical protein
MDGRDGYTRNTAECIKLGSEVASTEFKARLLPMAEKWLEAADRRALGVSLPGKPSGR